MRECGLLLAGGGGGGGQASLGTQPSVFALAAPVSTGSIRERSPFTERRVAQSSSRRVPWGLRTGPVEELAPALGEAGDSALSSEDWDAFREGKWYQSCPRAADQRVPSASTG